MTITTIGWITIITGLALTALTLVSGLRNGIKENQSELRRLESAGFASTYTAAPRKQSVYSSPIQGVKGKFAGPSRSARQMLKEVEEDIREENIALRKDNTIDAVLNPLRNRDENETGDTSSANHKGTSILEDDEVKEIRTSDGTDVLFSAVYSETDNKQKAKEKPKTDILNGTGVLSEGTDVLTEGTDVLQDGTGVLSFNKEGKEGTDILPKGETEPLVSYKEQYIKASKETAEQPEEGNGTDILAENTGILKDSAGTDVLATGTDVLKDGTDMLTAGTDILHEGTGILKESIDAETSANGTDILSDSEESEIPKGTDVLQSGTDILESNPEQED